MCVSLCECLDHFLGFWELIGKVMNGVSSRAEQWDLVGIFTFKRNSFFQSGGGVGGIPLLERQHPGGEGLSWGKGLQHCRASPARRQKQQFTRMPPTATRWFCISFLRGCLFKALVYFDSFQRELYQETSRENHLAIILLLTLISKAIFE